MSAETETFEGWAILELMGHRKLAGYVREVELAGHGVLRLDVPGYVHTEPNGHQEERGQATQFYSPSALYCLTPTTEEIARALAQRAKPAPVHAYELPAPKPPQQVLVGCDRCSHPEGEHDHEGMGTACRHVFPDGSGCHCTGYDPPAELDAPLPATTIESDWEIDEESGQVF